MVVLHNTYVPHHFTFYQLCLSYSIIFDQDINSPGHSKEVVDGINAIDKRYICQLMSAVQLPVSKRFYSQMQMYTINQKYDVSLAKEFQQQLEK